jgi:hypothetical protein
VHPSADFEERYRGAYAGLGVRLSPADGFTDEELAAVERSFAVSIPSSLRGYLRAAGREVGLNQAHNHLLPPGEWFIDCNRLVFLAENQYVVFWGVPLGVADPDPPVFQGINGEPIDWYAEHSSCSEFLCVMLHWQAVMGGLGRTWSAVVARNFPERLEGWTYVGEVNDMRAFALDGVALCWLPWKEGWRIFVASTDEAQVARLSEALSVVWDPDYE